MKKWAWLMVLMSVVGSASGDDGEAGEHVDLPLDFAWSAAVAMLAKSDSSGALDALKSLDWAVETDAGDSEVLSEAIAAQRKRRHGQG